MGERITAAALADGRPDEVARRLADSVTALAEMIDGGWFAGHEDTVGMEVELDLVDPLGLPRLVNDAVLARLDRPDLQHELGRFNIEFNLPPEPIAAAGAGHHASGGWPRARHRVAEALGRPARRPSACCRRSAPSC